MIGESSQKTIKLDSMLWDELDNWLKTPKAKKLGFHSKAQFATQAVRELLEQYTTTNRKPTDDTTNAKLDLIFKTLAILTKQTLESESGSEDSIARLKKKIEVAFKENAEYYTDLHRYLPGEKPTTSSSDVKINTSHKVVKSKSNPDLTVR